MGIIPKHFSTLRNRPIYSGTTQTIWGSTFLIVGLANTALGYSVIFGCMFLIGMSPELSNMTGYMVGLTISYSLNRYYTFKSVQKRRNEFVRFVVAFLVAYAANLIVLGIQVRIMGGTRGQSNFSRCCVCRLRLYDAQIVRLFN